MKRQYVPHRERNNFFFTDLTMLLQKGTKQFSIQSPNLVRIKPDACRMSIEKDNPLGDSFLHDLFDYLVLSAFIRPLSSTLHKFAWTRSY